MESIRTVSEACNSPMQLRGGDNGQKTWEWGEDASGKEAHVRLFSPPAVSQLQHLLRCSQPSGTMLQSEPFTQA